MRRGFALSTLACLLASNLAAHAATVTVNPPAYTVDPPAYTSNPPPFVVNPPSFTITVPDGSGKPGPAGPPGPVGPAGPQGVAGTGGGGGAADPALAARVAAIEAALRTAGIIKPVSAWELADQAPAAGATVQVPAGKLYKPLHLEAATVIQCAGMRATTFDGLGGADQGNRLAWGKGILHTSAPGLVVQDCGFDDTKRNGNGQSDGEAAVYGEGFPAQGTLTLRRVAIDGQENGVFVQPGEGGRNVDVILDRVVFGRNRSNGNNDGLSHDNYINGRSLTVQDSIYAGTSRGNTIKSRSPTVTVERSWIGRTTGRWLDLPARTVLVSRRNTYVTLPGANSGNAIGVFDENDTGNGGPVTSFLSEDDTFCFSRWQEVIWNNDPASPIRFVRARQIWAGAAGAAPPVLEFRGPGTVEGLRQMTEADRVDACPAMPADPAK